ncbi:sigma-70 family RNA polymerase sigma factor [Pseudomonas sp. PS1]|uniref:Sigma-70 family RNA polymerase sigma factor n=1 Tax=Stutzerimonas marianensis TaxID=2929513 RepID=A0A9X1W1J1_9GAMM|nr:sigma-70 family RNA polymerase sigma factor [Pseudomonas marianensis]MCJ0972942.1 sigma-70 family RNA polymerase sigma factor [Pseudomonas marianensis]
MERTTPHEVLKAREAVLQRLFLQGLDGDEAAYRQFLTLLGAHLRSFLKRRLQTAAVEDLLQETLLAVHNARHTYRADQPLTAWVQAIARYKLMDHFRAHARHEALNDPLDDQAALLADEDHQAEQAQRDLAKLLEQLPDKQRLPILHVKLQGLSVEETARRTGLSTSAVKVGVHRGLKALAALIGGSG